jgi:hypothetical protein
MEKRKGEGLANPRIILIFILLAIVYWWTVLGYGDEFAALSREYSSLAEPVAVMDINDNVSVGKYSFSVLQEKYAKVEKTLKLAGYSED